jgi:hypothetical protein
MIFVFFFEFSYLRIYIIHITLEPASGAGSGDWGSVHDHCIDAAQHA